MRHTEILTWNCNVQTHANYKRNTVSRKYSFEREKKNVFTKSLSFKLEWNKKKPQEISFHSSTFSRRILINRFSSSLSICFNELTQKWRQRIRHCNGDQYDAGWLVFFPASFSVTFASFTVIFCWLGARLDYGAGSRLFSFLPKKLKIKPGFNFSTDQYKKRTRAGSPQAVNHL